MRKWNSVSHRRHGYRNRIKVVLAAAGMAVLAMGCGDRTTSSETDVTEHTDEEAEAGPEMEDNEPTAAGTAEETGAGTGIAEETARDAVIDLQALRAENPEIFGWLHIPDTSIDAPLLQSAEGDDYYETHNAMKEADEGGALYIEAANLSSMCDFNTVIHGRTARDGESGLFADLYQFADPDFFDSHEQMYVYLDGNVLTYEIFAAYERENTSLLRTYDFTYIAGCSQFLEDLYGIRDMGMMIRAGWDEVTPYHFLITLTTAKGDDPDKQFVVLAALIDDPAGKIDRAVME